MRTVQLGQRLVPYRLRRMARRGVRMSVSVHGLHVTAPKSYPLGMVEHLLQQRSHWILTQLEVYAQLQQTLARAQPAILPEQWCSGLKLPWMGEALELLVAPAMRTTTRATAVLWDAPSKRLIVPLHQGQQHELPAKVQAWYETQARTHFQQRLAHYAPVMGVTFQRLRVMNARSRWGSASSLGNINLHWGLIQLAPELIDYVVVHELAHLKEMNHSPRFWAEVGKILPDYALRRKQLRSHPMPQRWA